jgi:cobalamin biosynthesis protein CobC
VSELLEHGGRLRAAAHDFHIPLHHWLDLSTGINPQGWPVADLPASVWQRLPEENDGLYMATVAYFGSTAVLPVAGSQAALQALPRLRARSRVGIVSPCYAEHAQAWASAGHAVLALAASDVAEQIDSLDVLLVVNPNNPTGAFIEPEVLLEWHARLRARGGWLLVDEAFVELQPALSVVAAAGDGAHPGLIVLRSLGKFWGLAGLRAGFVIAEATLLSELRSLLGPWALSHPARWVAQRAIMDKPWCEATRARLHADSERLRVLLAAHGLDATQGCGLFRWVPSAQAADLFAALAQRAVLVRPFSDGLRFGLPGSEAGWQQLDRVLGEVMA